MLGIGQQEVSSLLKSDTLRSIKIEGSRRIFLSDLEDYLGKERAQSLVREINSGGHSQTSGEARDQFSRYEPIAQKWSEIPDDESIVLSDLEKADIQNLRTLLYRRFDKSNVIVRAAKQKDGTFKAVIRAREGNKYLRE